MKRLANIKKYMAIGLGVSALALGVQTANAAPVTVDLCTGITTSPASAGSVPMWGYGDYDPGTSTCSNVRVPGPEIAVNEGDVVTINLTNTLPLPVSLIVTGHNVNDGGSNAGPDPTYNPDGRVRSLVAEAGGSGGTATYVVTAKAGSFIYHSATHQQVQVQMGLYGAMASSPFSPTYDNAITMFYSEIDPVLHNSVVGGCFSSLSLYMATGPDCGNSIPYKTSTMDYKPRYFLVNGATDDGSTATAAGDTGQDILVRMFNAGLKSRTMQLLGGYMDIVAENGSATPYAKTRHTADVHALGTTDVIINAATPGDYRLYDRRLAHSDGTTAGGINSTLSITAGAGAPPALNIPFVTDEDTSGLLSVLSAILATLPPGTDPASIDSASIAVVTDPIHGSAASNGDGTITYSPDANYNGADSFTYTFELGGVTSPVSTVSITVNPVNDAPVATADSYDVVAGSVLNVAAPGVLSNDSDIDGDALTAVGLAVDGSFSFDATALLAGAVDSSISYSANDGTVDSAPVTVTINVTAPPSNIAPVAVDETVTWSRNANAFVDPVTGLTRGTIKILANDSDPDGATETPADLNPASVVLSATAKENTKLVAGVGSRQRGSSVLLLASGEVSYTPPISGGGTDVFTYTVADNLGSVSNTATVRINLVK